MANLTFIISAIFLVPKLCISNVGTFPMLWILNVGTVPILYIPNVGTIPFIVHVKYMGCPKKEPAKIQEEKRFS